VFRRAPSVAKILNQNVMQRRASLIYSPSMKWQEIMKRGNQHTSGGKTGERQLRSANAKKNQERRDEIGGTERRRHHPTKYKEGKHIQHAIDKSMTKNDLKTNAVVMKHRVEVHGTGNVSKKTRTDQFHQAILQKQAKKEEAKIAGKKFKDAPYLTMKARMYLSKISIMVAYTHG